ncbi:hypothetical protein ON010_g16664 [Phytophthora cinnamomi]|nr:hypothetical protein ON010_g16664 [Phytophthora cinnamomi]
MEKFHEKELYGKIRPSSTRGRSLDGAFEDAANELRGIISEEKAHVNKLHAQWVAGSFRPLIIIEDQGFIEFVVYITQVLGHVNVPLLKRAQLRRLWYREMKPKPKPKGETRGEEDSRRRRQLATHNPSPVIGPNSPIADWPK